MRIEEIRSPLLNESLGIYSQGIKVVHPGSLIYLSGFTSRDREGRVVGEGDIKIQTDTILNNIRIALAEAGAQMKDIVKMTVFIRDMNMFKEIHEVRARYFAKPYPACSMVEVSRLVSPEHLIEIEVVAAISD